MKKRALHNFAEGYFIEGRNVVLEDKFGGTKIGIACVCVCVWGTVHVRVSACAYVFTSKSNQLKSYHRVPYGRSRHSINNCPGSGRPTGKKVDAEKTKAQKGGLIKSQTARKNTKHTIVQKIKSHAPPKKEFHVKPAINVR